MYVFAYVVPVRRVNPRRVERMERGQESEGREFERGGREVTKDHTAKEYLSAKRFLFEESLELGLVIIVEQMVKLLQPRHRRHLPPKRRAVLK